MKEEKVKTVTDKISYLLILTCLFLLGGQITVKTQRKVEIQRKAMYSKHTVLGRKYGLSIT